MREENLNVYVKNVGQKKSGVSTGGKVIRTEAVDDIKGGRTSVNGSGDYGNQCKV